MAYKLNYLIINRKLCNVTTNTLAFAGTNRSYR